MALDPAGIRACDDATLAMLAGEGDAGALEEIYDRHGGACYGLARRVVRDEHLAQDVVQEVFLAVWRRAARYDQRRGALLGWLLTLTHHKAVDAVRRADRHSRRRVDDSVLDSAADPDADVEEQVWSSIRRDRVRAALRGLPEPQREALLLAYFGGHTQVEIAGLTGAPLGTVKTRTLAALRRLHTQLSIGEDTTTERGDR